jgi:hypothetical protein
MSATRRSPAEGTSTVNLPLFLITLPRTWKSLEIFKMTSLCHIAIRTEVYKAQTGLTQCYNCQKFGRVWANCKQPARWMWCGGGGGQLHKECQEKDSAASISCCNCKWVHGEEPNLSNYPGCRHARGEMRKRKLQGAPKTTSGILFQPHHPWTVLRGGAAQQHSSSSLFRPQLHRPAPPPLRHSQVPTQFRLLMLTVRFWTTCS